MSVAVLANESSNIGALLPAITLVPFVGAIVIALMPKSRPELVRTAAIASAVITGTLGVFLLTQFHTEEAGYQFVTKATWIEALDIKFALGVDGISLFLVVLTGVMFAFALFASSPDHDAKGYYAWITLLEAGCMGAFLSLDLFLFFVMFELTIVPLYMLIGQWGHGHRVYAANKFFIYTLLGSVLMLVAIVVLAVNAHAGDGGAISFDLQKIMASGALDKNLARWLFLGFAIAFAVKTPIFPFHTWLPDAHTEAPTGGSVNLAAVVLKLGTYGFLRFGLGLFPEAAVFFAPALLTLGVVGIIYGAVVAAMQKNLKRLVAYSSVSHMGFAIIGLFSLTTIGIEGSLLVMINHGIATGALFILLGYLYSRRHTYEIAELNGLQKVAPWFAGAFTLVMLASIGLPGLNGFVGEFLTLLGTFIAHRWWAVAAGSGVIMAALYLLWAYQRVFHGEPSEANKSFPDLAMAERLTLIPLIALIVFLGVYPKPVLDRIEPSVKALVHHMEEVNPDYREPHGKELEGGGAGEGEKVAETNESNKSETPSEATHESGAAATDPARVEAGR
jgi:NADH-quinone oxidoreductase subunit M